MDACTPVGPSFTDLCSLTNMWGLQPCAKPPSLKIRETLGSISLALTLGSCTYSFSLPWCPCLCSSSVPLAGWSPPWESWYLSWWNFLRVPLKFPSLWCPSFLGSLQASLHKSNFMFCAEVSGRLPFLPLCVMLCLASKYLCVSSHPIAGCILCLHGPLWGWLRGPLLKQTLGWPPHLRVSHACIPGSLKPSLSTRSSPELLLMQVSFSMANPTVLSQLNDKSQHLLSRTLF